MAKAVFSVGEKQGQKSVRSPYGFMNVSQREVAFVGKCRVVHAGDAFFGTGKPYVGPILTNPTWGKLCGEAGRMIEATGDRHHIYFEGIMRVVPTADVAEITLCMGS